MTPDLIVRDARAEDRPALVRFMASLQDFERAIEPNRTPGAEMADGHLAYLEGWAAETGGVLVAELEGALAGFAVWGTEDEGGSHVPAGTRTYGAVSDLWIEPGQRGRGIARALIAEVEDRLRARGIGQLQITAVAGNDQALRLYRALGYADYEVTLAKTL